MIGKKRGKELVKEKALAGEEKNFYFDECSKQKENCFRTAVRMESCSSVVFDLSRCFISHHSCTSFLLKNKDNLHIKLTTTGSPTVRLLCREYSTRNLLASEGGNRFNLFQEYVDAFGGSKVAIPYSTTYFVLSAAVRWA